MKQEYTELMQQALKKWGKNSQVMMALEEMSELSKELLKNINRNSDNRQEILEEISDVWLLLEQMKIVYDISEQELADSMAGKLGKLRAELENA
ncbi:MAG: hypothetical protein FWG68_03800 [Defluviitaleaceae bacterium]|nr:hypothetical protein [Defluviitaleaceae bacterium]